MKQDTDPTLQSNGMVGRDRGTLDGTGSQQPVSDGSCGALKTRDTSPRLPGPEGCGAAAQTSPQAVDSGALVSVLAAGEGFLFLLTLGETGPRVGSAGPTVLGLWIHSSTAHHCAHSQQPCLLSTFWQTDCKRSGAQPGRPWRGGVGRRAPRRREGCWRSGALSPRA